LTNRKHTPRPAAADPILGGRFGAWTAAKANPSDRRVTCQCSCGVVRQIVRDALTSGQSKGCAACSATWVDAPVRRPDPTLARELAAAERFGARHRHRGRPS